jgi:hypothetical protein
MTDPLHGWYEHAGVRGQKRRILHEDREQGRVLFPEKEIPYLENTAVAALPPGTRQMLVARHLYQYLLFTVHLETVVRADVRHASRHTVKLLDSVGALDLPGVRDHLCELGLAR